MIEIVAAAAKEALGPLGWRLANIDRAGRGSAEFTNDDGLRLIFEIGSWWPPNAHHLDDQPGVVLSVQDKDSPKVQVPSLGQDEPQIFWSSSDDDIRKQTLTNIRDFESFLAACPDRRTLYNRVLDRWLERHGIMGEALFNAIKDALAYDQAGSVTWARRKLSLLSKHLRDRGRIFAFDPAVDRLRMISSLSEFDAYVSASLPHPHEDGTE